MDKNIKIYVCSILLGDARLFISFVKADSIFYINIDVKRFNFQLIICCNSV